MDSRLHPRPDERGHLIIESVIFILLATSAWLYLSVGAESDAVIDSEDDAILRIERIIEAQDAFRNRHGRYGFLEELGDPKVILGETAIRGRRVDSPWIFENYCYLLYLANGKGEELLHPDLEEVRPDFWVVYAWPKDYGYRGRRVFSADSFGQLQTWDNPLGTFDGSERIPAASLAPHPEGREPVFTRKNQGYLGHVSWKPVPRSHP